MRGLDVTEIATHPMHGRAGERGPLALHGWRRVMASAVAILITAASVSHAQPVTVPTDLNPCEEYRLAFVTSTASDATSTGLATYNTRVTNAASTVPELVALGTNWRAIAATLASPAARDNTDTNPDTSVGVSIYRLDDTRLANGNADLWGGTFIAVPLNVAENTSTVVSRVWTGSAFNGASAGSNHGLGGTGGQPPQYSIFGESGSSFATWISSGLIQDTSFSYRLYAISDVLTVPGPPSSNPLTNVCLRITYGAASIVQGPLSWGLSEQPESVTADVLVSGFGKTENIVAGLADVESFTLRYGDGLWTSLTSFSLVTDGNGEVTTLSYATTAITTPTVVANPILNNSFSITFAGTDIASGQDLEYFYAESAQTLTLEAVPLPSLAPWGLLLLACGLAAGGRALVGRTPKAGADFLSG